MYWQIFFLCLTSIATSAMAAPQQEQKAKPLTLKEKDTIDLSHIPDQNKDTIDLSHTSDQNKVSIIKLTPRLPYSNESNNEPKIFDTYKASSAACDKYKMNSEPTEINKKAINDHIPPHFQRSEITQRLLQRDGIYTGR